MEDLTLDSSDSLKEFYIPDYVFNSDSEPENVSEFPEYPIVVFVNSKSGGQLGGHLLVTYRSLLNKNQIVDVLEEAPEKFLNRLYQNLEILKQKEDQLAFKIEEKLKIIVAGGDGTAGWILGVVCDLNLPRTPPIATVPLGTGNNLPFAFGWGKRNPGTDTHSVKSFLHQVKKAKEMKVDNWHILMRMKIPQGKNCDPVAPLELPHSLHVFKRATSVEDNMEGYLTFRGGFWNYFSMGMDAQVSYAFDSERKLHPEKFKNQLSNQSTYARIGCKQGWLFASLSHPTDNIIKLAKVMVMKKQGDWEELRIPNSIRSIVCLNLPSFSGGLNPWGTPNKNRPQYRDFTPPYVDDGLLEVVGFTDAWHFLTLMAPNGHGTRLAQAHRIRFEFHKGGADHTYMRIDGEPWKQPLPVDDDTVIVEISHHGQANMLVTHDCQSKSIHDPARHDESVEGDIEDEAIEEGEEWKKFGAAETFKIPDEVDISQLS